jgi:hypothetical protein
MTEQTYEEWMNEGANKREAAAQASRLFNEAAIERILNNVGKQHWPPTLDREALTAALERVARLYPDWHTLDNQPSDGGMRKRVELIHKTARKLVTLLPKASGLDGEDLDPLMRLLLTAACDGGNEADARRAIKSVSSVVTMCNTILQNNLYSLNWSGHRSAESWLIGDALPNLYAQHFDRQFAMSRDKSTRLPGGPGIRFIVEVLRTMGVVTRDGKQFEGEAIEYYLRPR